MSHVAQCAVVVRDMRDLKAAVERLGGSLVEGKTSIKWYGRFVDDSDTWVTFFTPERVKEIQRMSPTARKAIITNEMSRCDHAIKFPGVGYEVGVVKHGDGTFRLRYDEFDHSLQVKMGPGGGKLSQAYALEAAKRAAKLKGWMSREIAQKGGSIKLEVYAS